MPSAETVAFIFTRPKFWRSAVIVAGIGMHSRLPLGYEEPYSYLICPEKTNRQRLGLSFNAGASALKLRSEPSLGVRQA